MGTALRVPRVQESISNNRVRLIGMGQNWFLPKLVSVKTGFSF